MFNPRLRLILVLAAILVAGTLWTQGRTSAAGLALAAATMLTVGYWRNASVWRAWHAYWAGEVATAERYLAMTPEATRLAPQQRAYYEWLQGEVRRQRGDAAGARPHFRAALSGPLRSSKDRAFAYARLAEAALTVGDVTDARRAIAEARALHPPPFVEALLVDVEHAMAAG